MENQTLQFNGWLSMKMESKFISVPIRFHQTILLAHARLSISLHSRVVRLL